MLIGFYSLIHKTRIEQIMNAIVLSTPTLECTLFNYKTMELRWNAT